jgi:hypothetical protein
MSLDSFIFDDTGGVDQRQMGEPLREVPDLPACDGVVLFREEAQMIPDRKQPLEELLRFRLPSLECVVIGEPEAARQKRTLVAWKAVQPEFRGVSQDEAVAHELRFDRMDRRHHSGIVGRQEADERNCQDAHRALVNRTIG